MSLDPPSGERPSLRVVQGADSGSPYPKCSLWLRAGARAFDVAIAFGLYVTFGQAGSVVALLFLLLSDGLLQGQSVGKRLFGIKVVHLPTRTGAGWRESVLRNAPFALVVLLGMMPEPLGPLAFAAGALVIGGVEGFKVLKDPLGIRLGDVWGQTQVVDGKVVIGALATHSAREPAGAGGRMMYGRRRRARPQEEDAPCASR